MLFKQYQNCLKNFYFNKDESVLLYLAKAYFEWNKMEECKQTLQKAIHIAPHNMALWYNLALAQKAYSTSILKKEKKTITELSAATKELEQATCMFEHLATRLVPASNPSSSTQPTNSTPTLIRPNYSTTKAATHIKSCQNFLADARRQLDTARDSEERELQRLNKQQELLAESARKQLEEQERIDRETEERQQREEEAAQEVYEKNLQVVQKFVDSSANNDERESSQSFRAGRRKKSKKANPNQAGNTSPIENEETESWEEMRDKRVSCQRTYVLAVLTLLLESQSKGDCKKTEGKGG